MSVAECDGNIAIIFFLITNVRNVLCELVDGASVVEVLRSTLVGWDSNYILRNEGKAFPRNFNFKLQSNTFFSFYV